MADCYITRRGGGGLNFTVKAYASELLLPTVARENTIAVITETPITGWSFAAEAPETPYEGMVLFYVSDDAYTPFNAVRKNELMVYPNKAHQYVNGAWVSVMAKIYQNGAWKTLAHGRLDILVNGVPNAALNQGATIFRFELSSSSHKDAELINGSGFVRLTTPLASYSYASTTLAVPTSKYNTIYIDMKATWGNNQNSSSEIFRVGGVALLTATANFARTVKTLDISSVTEDMAITMAARAWGHTGNNADQYYYNIWME